MISNAVYENSNIRCVTGETLRPGGFLLTKRAVSNCGFEKGQKILDVGCGMGATVKFLIDEYDLKASGIDPSEKLIHLGKEKYGLPLMKGRGESLPYEDGCFDGVFAECTLSLMESCKATIKEVYRVLKPCGLFVVSDMYARNPEYIYELKKMGVKSCLGNLFDLSLILKEMDGAGFRILVLEDWTSLLKKLMVEIIFKYDSMTKFWKATTCGSCEDFQEKLSLCKPGYFFMIGEKEGK